MFYHRALISECTKGRKVYNNFFFLLNALFCQNSVLIFISIYSSVIIFLEKLYHFYINLSRDKKIFKFSQFAVIQTVMIETSLIT